MTIIKAETILSSERYGKYDTRTGHVLWSGLLTYPRCIHAEFMTHRVLSKNSASSRAIPVKRMIQDVIDHPYIPIKWGKNMPGMQATEYFEGADVEELRAQWLSDRDAAVRRAQWYVDRNAHKQIVNRILEPYAHIKVFVTGDQWSNFLALRDHPAAEPHMQLLAKEIRREVEKKPMQFLLPGQWHLPWVRQEEMMKYPVGVTPHVDLIKLSIARSAHTSYQTVDGHEMTFSKAIEVADKILSADPLHASPTEHQAMVSRTMNADNNLNGNFLPGFTQYRKLLANECR